MRKKTPLKLRILPLALLALTACMPNLPATIPPTQDPTLIVIAAEATVTAMAKAKLPTATLPGAQKPTAAPAVTATTAPASDFWVAYISKNKLAATNSDGTKKSLLTNTPGVDYLPAWSPDGKELAFLRFDGENRQDGNLHLLSSGSNTPRILDPSRTYNNFIWMPDSQQILAAHGFIYALEMYLLNIPSGQQIQVAKDVSEFPRLSPDGKQIAMLVNTGTPCNGKGCTLPNDLFLYQIATRETTRLTGDTLPKTGIAWAPDSQQIAYHLVNEANNVVEIVQPDGKVVASKANPPWWKENWQRSHDGAQIAYYVNDTNNGGVDIFTIAGDGSGEPRKVTRVDKSTNKVAYIDTLRWRPDGSGLVFNTWTGIYTVNLDGSGLRSLPVTLENVFFDVRPTTDSYTPAPDPTPPASWKLCPGGMDSRLDVGRQAQVTTDPPTPNNVRESPSRTSKLLGQIKPGEKIEVTSGPVCDHGLTWWEIHSLVSDLKGYTLEGDLKTYWLVPLP